MTGYTKKIAPSVGARSLTDCCDYRGAYTNAHENVINLNPGYSNDIPKRPYGKVCTYAGLKHITQIVHMISMLDSRYMLKHTPMLKRTHMMKNAPMLKHNLMLKHAPMMKDALMLRHTPMLTHICMMKDTHA